MKNKFKVSLSQEISALRQNDDELYKQVFTGQHREKLDAVQKQQLFDLSPFNSRNMNMVEKERVVHSVIVNNVFCVE